MTRRAGGTVWLLGALAWAACDAGAPPATPEPEARPLRVFAVHYPLQYFAERVGGEAVEVYRLPPGVDPADWSPPAETVAAAQAADLVLLDGAGYARWVERASLPRARGVDTGAGFRDRLLPVEDPVTHTHGPEGEHSHRGFASTTWLDPALALEQARAVGRALVAARPADADGFERRLEALEQELRAFDARLSRAAQRLGSTPLVFSHPVYGYLIRRYGLDARSLHWEPDELPGEPAWRELEALLEEHPAPWVLWEAEPLPETARRLEALGLGVAVFATGGGAPEAGDFGDLMARNAAVLESLSAAGE